ncbi:MAG: shikimate kinase [Candidatus Eremiobacteraeota bacterium]|nr:shikimate kinase [Candidatus Eremiobacteraeota bacterium]
MKRHVALVGFMASGKTTIGRKLAKKLRRPFCDTDALIVQNHGSIQAIFANEGETAFRRYESEAIQTALDREEGSVIALGGGALTVKRNCKLLDERAYRVFIKVPAEQILARVRRSREVRPVLGSAPTLESVGALYATRMTEYEKADHVVEVARRSDATVVAEIVEWLRGTVAQ